MEVSTRPSLREEYGTVQPRGDEQRSYTKSQQAGNNHRDERILRDMWWVIGLGLSVFLGGFGI